jgi:predicted flap endonuclease-1-like 5' DNA nuclease
MSRLETLPKISAPATRALANAGITSLSQLAGCRRAELAALHGIGPKALSILEASLAEVGLQLRD